MNPNNFLISDGYIGCLGEDFVTPSAAELERAIDAAVEIENKPRQEIINLLESGVKVRWCKSPNFYYDHSYGVIVKKVPSEKIKMVICNCGHEVPDGLRMSTSRGSSCPDCYDWMSE